MEMQKMGQKKGFPPYERGHYSVTQIQLKCLTTTC